MKSEIRKNMLSKIIPQFYLQNPFLIFATCPAQPLEWFMHNIPFPVKLQIKKIELNPKASLESAWRQIVQSLFKWIQIFTAVYLILELDWCTFELQLCIPDIIHGPEKAVNIPCWASNSVCSLLLTSSLKQSVGLWVNQDLLPVGKYQHDYHLFAW